MKCEYCQGNGFTVHALGEETCRRCTGNGYSKAAPTQGADEPIARALHYPDHWDTAAYPDVYSALSEVMAHFECECERTQGSDARPVAITEEHRTSIENAILALDEGVAPGSEHANDLRCVLRDLATRDAAPSDPAIDALKWIKVLVCGDSAPRWTNAHQTSVSRGMIADIVDKAIAATAPREKT